MQSTTVFQATRPTVAVRPARRSVAVQASAPREAQKPQQKAALAALAAFAATVLVSSAPVQAADVKTTVCRSNPTARICLKNSAKQ